MFYGDIMLSVRELFEQRLKQFNSPFMDSFDYDFSSVTEKINTIDEFDKKIIEPSCVENGLYYRGERVNSNDRRLIPTMLREPKKLLERSDYGVLHIDSEFLFSYYSSMGEFVELYNKTMGKADEYNLYEISAFAQHYCDFSPLIDFTKSVYPALSFALKDRQSFSDDIVLYVLKLNNQNDYTNDIVVANKWLKELNIYLTAFDENDVKNAIEDAFELKNRMTMPDPEDFKKQLEQLNTPPSPTAKLIDVPTNTRMKFQQGVFLLLTDFNLFRNSYLTKSIRNSFTITKYIINKNICPNIKSHIDINAPWYSYKYLTDVEGAFKEAIEKTTEPIL